MTEFPNNVFEFLWKCNISVLEEILEITRQSLPDSQGITRGGFSEISQYGEVIFSNTYLHDIFHKALVMTSKALFTEINEQGAFKATEFINNYLKIKNPDDRINYNTSSITMDLVKISIIKKHAKLNKERATNI